MPVIQVADHKVWSRKEVVLQNFGWFFQSAGFYNMVEKGRDTN
jgi:hypothetical protein